MNKVQILIDGFEYFKVTNIVLQEVIEGFLSIRTTNIDILFNNMIFLLQFLFQLD